MYKNTKNILTIILSVLLFLQSCATAPNKVFPLTARISDNKSCSYYEEELFETEKREEELALYQKELRDNDSLFTGLAVGLGIFIWPLAFLAFGIKGDDAKTQEYAEVKGKIASLNKIMAENCN